MLIPINLRDQVMAPNSSGTCRYAQTVPTRKQMTCCSVNASSAPKKFPSAEPRCSVPMPCTGQTPACKHHPLARDTSRGLASIGGASDTQITRMHAQNRFVQIGYIYICTICNTTHIAGIHSSEVYQGHARMHRYDAREM